MQDNVKDNEINKKVNHQIAGRIRMKSSIRSEEENA